MYETLVGLQVRRVEFVAGQNRMTDGDSGYVVITFENGMTLYADAPTLYEPGVSVEAFRT